MGSYPDRLKRRSTMTINSQQDIDGILRVGRVVTIVRDTMLDALEPVDIVTRGAPIVATCSVAA
jgi:hypothetical protein